MTLLDEAPPNAESVTVAWLSELGPASIVRKAGDPLPFRLVTRVAGADDGYELDRAVVSVHTFATTMSNAAREADKTHRRMLYLAQNPLTDIVLPGNRVANVTFCQTFQSPNPLDYGDEQIERYVARYRLGLSFVAVP